MTVSVLKQIVARNAPVLCLDTCVVLDLMRDPTRDEIRGHERQEALKILSAMEAGNGLVGLYAGQVQREYNDHVEDTERQARNSVKRLQEQVARVNALDAIYGGNGIIDLTHLDDHHARARAIAERIMKVSFEVTGSSSVLTKAFERVNTARAPAAKGKAEIKDCVIIETYLELVAEIRKLGHVDRIVFASSNTKDYAQTNTAQLKPDLELEFQTVNMKFAPNLGAARHLLGI